MRQLNASKDYWFSYVKQKHFYPNSKYNLTIGLALIYLKPNHLTTVESYTVICWGGFQILVKTLCMKCYDLYKVYYPSHFTPSQINWGWQGPLEAQRLLRQGHPKQGAQAYNQLVFEDLYQGITIAFLGNLCQCLVI